MNKVTQLESVDEVLKVWPRLYSLAQSDGSMVSAEALLQLFLRCLEDGAVFIVTGVGGLVGSCCVECDDDSAILHSLPRNGDAEYGKECLSRVREWAHDNGLTVIRATTTKLNGSSYRYFEKSLGFRRHSVTFQMQV